MQGMRETALKLFAVFHIDPLLPLITILPELKGKHTLYNIDKYVIMLDFDNPIAKMARSPPQGKNTTTRQEHHHRIELFEFLTKTYIFFKCT